MADLERNYDFALERRLTKLNPELSKRYTGCMFLFENMLKTYTAQFPEFTDHTLMHSMNVVNYSNQLLGENIEKLNEDEIYCYLMGVLVHDVGMGIKDDSFEEFSHNFGIAEYAISHPEDTKAEIIRKFHNDFSYIFTMKYWELFDIPDESYARAIAFIGRAHRKVNLLNAKDTPTTIVLSTGNEVHVPSLGALIRVADEMDMGADRNLDLLYDMQHVEDDYESELSIKHFKRHKTIDSIYVGEEVVVFKINDLYPEAHDELLECIDEVIKKLRYYIEVASKRPYLFATQRRLIVEKADGSQTVYQLS